MRVNEFTPLLIGKDLRTIRKNSIVVQAVRDQHSFDELFKLMLHHERPLVMRAADAIEKITSIHPEFLKPHKVQLLTILKSADHKELKWHIAQLVPRIALSEEELQDAWHIFTYWALNRHESKIVRVNALQALFEISRQFPHLKRDYEQTLQAMAKERIPSIQARIRKLLKLDH